MNFSISSAVIIVPVGLLGLAMNITLVLSVILSAIASISYAWFFSGTVTAVAPATFVARV